MQGRVPQRSPTVSPGAQRHLIAARRLSRRIGRYADQSPEQLRAGRLICRHLVAMLKEAEAEPKAH
jgi:hypothetical protein